MAWRREFVARHAPAVLSLVAGMAAWEIVGRHTDAAFLVPRLDQARRAAASAFDAALADGARLPLAAALARARSWLEGATATRAAASTIRTG